MTFSVLPVGAPARKKLDAVRRELGQISAEMDGLEGAVLPAEEAAERTMASALPLIMRARAERSGMFRHRVPAAFNAPEGLALLRDALCDTEELRKQLLAFYTADGLGSGVTDQVRTDRTRALAARREQLLADEENLTRDLEQAGFVVDRNAEIDPALLLRVWDSRA